MSRRVQSQLIAKLYGKVRSLSGHEIEITRSDLRCHNSVNRGCLRLTAHQGGHPKLRQSRDRLLADLHAEGWRRDPRTVTMLFLVRGEHVLFLSVDEVGSLGPTPAFDLNAHVYGRSVLPPVRDAAWRWFIAREEEIAASSSLPPSPTLDPPHEVTVP